MKRKSAILLAVLTALALIFVAGCSDDSEESSSYNSHSDYYGTYSDNSSDIFFTFTSTSWSYTYTTAGIGVSGSTWEYSNGYIYCYIDGEPDFYVLTVTSTSRLSFQGATLTKSISIL